jgi:hypothetical protein
MATELTRPNAIRWVWYALGGRLPHRYRDWVLHDLTAPTWGWRHLARSTVLLTPLCTVWLLLPGMLWLRVALVVLAAVVGYLYSFAYMEEGAEYRLSKYGFPRGTGKAIRAASKAEAEREMRERYIAFYRQQN